MSFVTLETSSRSLITPVSPFYVLSKKKSPLARIFKHISPVDISLSCFCPHGSLAAESCGDCIFLDTITIFCMIARFLSGLFCLVFFSCPFCFAFLDSAKLFMTTPCIMSCHNCWKYYLARIMLRLSACVTIRTLFFLFVGVLLPDAGDLHGESSIQRAFFMIAFSFFFFPSRHCCFPRSRSPLLQGSNVVTTCVFASI